MSFLIGVLLFILFLNALFLILLILVQLPKKEAGIGMAFGGGAGEALFQGGAANALSKMTTKAAIVFLSVTMLVSILVSARNASTSTGKLDQLLTEESGGSVLPPSDDAGSGLPAAAPTNNSSGIDIPVQTPASTNQPVEIEIPVADEPAVVPPGEETPEAEK
jgi:preprotein translocase subunit SecG